ncbi:MAG: helix-turn-helix transcriptional regulator [Pseudonocardiales bacterium]|nr:helix-turn-helix transcriptional regulator [Pseudonocardiales bacterium]
MGSGEENLIGKLAGNTPPVDPGLLARPEVRAALASHDIGTLFRVLNATGWSQRGIAGATKMHQSEVSEIINKGRQVTKHQVLVRIADGLGIPRELMNLGPTQDVSAYPGGSTRGEHTEEEIATRRRHIIMAVGTTAYAAQGKPVKDLEPRPELLGPAPAPASAPLPSRIQGIDVVQVRKTTQDLSAASRAYGSNPWMSSAAVTWATGLLELPGTEQIKQALMVAITELQLHAAWATFDAGLHDHTIDHCICALELATQTGDPHYQTVALNVAGLATVERGRPNDGLAMLQLSQLIAEHIPANDERPRVGWPGSRASLQACGLADSATALALMGDHKGAAVKMAKARELWQPTPADPNGDLDQVAARLELGQGRLEKAEPFAAASMRRWDGAGSNRARTLSGILLATIHVRAGEPDGLRLAHEAITSVTKLSSQRARQRLTPLAAALDARPSTDAHDLARTARHLTTTRA